MPDVLNDNDEDSYNGDRDSAANTGQTSAPEHQRAAKANPQRRSVLPALELVARLRSEAADEPLPNLQTGVAVERPEQDATVCAHLGLEQNPFAHHDEPSPEHRCYLWMQRDRIDVAHQAMFCLTSQSTSCPWLSISSPKQAPPLHRRAAQAVARRLPAQLDELDSSWQRIMLTVLLTFVTWLERAWRIVEPILLQLGMALLVGLRALGGFLLRPLLAISRAYGRLQRKATAAVSARLATIAQRPASSAAAVADQPTVNLEESKLEASAIEPALLQQEAGSQVEWHTVARGPSQVASPQTPVVDAPGVTIADGAAAAEEYIHRGMEAIREGDTAAALRRFRLATAADARNEQAWLLLGAIVDSHEEKAECFRRALALNPASTRARIGLEQLGIATEAPKPRASQDGGFAPLNRTQESSNDRSSGTRVQQDDPGTDLLQNGLRALQVGSEELAYEYFSSATKANPADEQAWYWRAKTAPTLDELVECLERIIEINPDNMKVQVDLQWALQRRQQALAPPPAPTPAPALTTARVPKSRLAAMIREWLLQLAAASAFVSALLLTLPYVISLTDWATVPEFQPFLRYLPAFHVSSIPINSDFAPAFDLGPALPLIFGVLLLHAAFGLGDGAGRPMRYWSATVAAATIVLFVFYASPLSLFGVAASTLALALSLAGQAAPAAFEQVK